MPTAVMTESSEKTMSSSMIWTMTAAKDDGRPRAAMHLLAFELLVDFECALADQEETADEQDEVAAGELLARTVNERLGQADRPS